MPVLTSSVGTTECLELFNPITKINDYIYLGPADHVLGMSPEFQKLNVDVIINCCQEINYESCMEFTVEKFPIVEGDPVSFMNYMDRAGHKIHQYLLAGKKIYLHSTNSLSRAPAIFIYYLMSFYKINFDMAFYLLQQLRPNIHINQAFVDVLDTTEA